LCSHKSRSCKWRLSFTFTHQNPVWIYIFTHAFYMSRTSFPFEIQNICEQLFCWKQRCLVVFGWSRESYHRNDKGFCESDHLLMCQDAAHGPHGAVYAYVENVHFLRFKRLAYSLKTRNLLTFYSLAVTTCTVRCNIKISVFCSHSMFLCSVWFVQQTADFCQYNIHRLVFVVEAYFVFWEVRTENL
jgi:hypothetical protein